MENNVNQQQQNGEGNAANGQQNDHQLLHNIWNHIVRMPPLLVSISQAVLGLQNVFADKIQVMLKNLFSKLFHQNTLTFLFFKLFFSIFF